MAGHSSDSLLEATDHDANTFSGSRPLVVRTGPGAATIGPVVSLEYERVEALELLGMVLAHLSITETRSELSPRAPLLMGIRDNLAEALREEQ